MVFQCLDLQFSTEILEAACDNIIDEIIDFLIEGICFEVHRSVKLDYYPAQEYAVNQLEFELFQGVDHPGEKRDIYYNDRSKEVAFSHCQFCGQKKAAQTLVRHMNICRARTYDQPIWCEKFEAREKSKEKAAASSNAQKATTTEEHVENDSDDSADNCDTTDCALSYDEMPPDDVQEFLKKHCGVVSKKTGKPCRNSMNCNMHSKESKAEIRTFVFESLAIRMADDYANFL